MPQYGGTLEHFAGDGVLVFFNDPLPVEEHELQSIRFALAAQARFAELSEACRKRGIERAHSGRQRTSPRGSARRLPPARR
jgi:class 3 adenylate cyclase